MRKLPLFLPAILTFLFLSFAVYLPSMAAKERQTVSTKIQISAPPKAVFEAIRLERGAEELHRKLVSFDGHTAVIHEKIENVPIHGEVECVWEEIEEPYTRIEYKMLESTKFKEGFGSWNLIASEDGKSTTLELCSYTDPGIDIPFADALTKMSTSKNAQFRLGRIKKEAESLWAKEEAAEESNLSKLQK